MATSTDELRAEMQATLTDFFRDSASAFRNKDPSLCSSKLPASCTRHVKPAWFPATYPFMKAVLTNADYEARVMAEVTASFEDARVKILESVIDPVERKPSVHSKKYTKWIGREETVIELCWYFDFTEDGKQVLRIVEFLDTARSAEAVEGMKKDGLAVD